MDKEWISLIGKYELAGARTRFENICTNLYKALYSDSNVRNVEVRNGDGGIDIFIGEIGIEPIFLIQCKFFPDGINQAQKNQIRKSFNTAINSREYSLKDWTLCVINTLTLSENKWWVKWKRKNLAAKHPDNFIQLKDGDDLVMQLKSVDLYNEAFEKEDSIKIDEIHKFLIASPDVATLNEAFNKASFYISKVKRYFGNNPQMHVKRQQVENIAKWVSQELVYPKKNVLIIEGGKGNGKSVIIQETYKRLKQSKDLILCIKADKYYSETAEGLERKLFLDSKITFTKIKETIQKHGCNLIVIIDQLDALSQTLSSNREYLYTYNRIIAELEDINNVRVIISTRSFDLKHDANLSIYNTDNYEKIKVDVLPEPDVVNVLSTLGIKDIPKRKLVLLKTPHHLEMFLKLPNKGVIKDSNISSLKGLYDELWTQIISSKPELKSKELLYAIAAGMYENEQNIIVQNVYNDSYYQELNYLKSNQLLIEDNNEIQFFHQTLYDYCFSRQFVDKGQKLTDYILENNQSLYIRSVVKMIIEYLRDAQGKEYIDTLKNILVDPEYRFHLKVLIINILGSIQQPTKKEKDLIRTFVIGNEEFEEIFLLSIQSKGWIQFVIEEELFSDFSRSIETAWILFRNNIGNDPLLVMQYLDSRNEFENKRNFIERILSFNDNWEPPELKNYFDKYIIYSEDNERANLWYYDILKKVSDHDINFAFDKFTFILSGLHERNVFSDSWGHQFALLVEHLYPKAPSSALCILLDGYFNAIEHSKYPMGYEKVDSSYYASKEFYPFNYSDTRKETIDDFLRKYIIDLAPNREVFLPILNKYKNTNSWLVLSHIIRGLKVNPSLYSKEIFELINIIHSKNGLLADDDTFQFSIRKLIGSVFEFFSDKKRTVILTLIHNLKLPKDKVYLFHYWNEKKKICNYIGNRQYLFFNSIPYLELKSYDTTRRLFHELNRKFGKISDSKPSDDFGGIAGIVSAPLNGKAYENMSLEDWKKSMMKYDEQYRGAFDSLKGGMREHGNQFEIKVQQNPEFYYDFILDVLNVDNISKEYSLYGLRGLIAGKYDVVKTKVLYLKLIDSCLSQDISFVHLLIYATEYFIKLNAVDEHIIKFLNAISRKKLHFKEQDDKYIVSLAESAIHQLINCSDYKEYEQYIFQGVEEALAENISSTNETIIRNLAMLNHLDIDRAFLIFKKITNTDDYSILKSSLWSAHYFNNQFHSDMDFYFERIIGNEKLHKDASIIVLSWLNENINDKNWYDQFVISSFEAKICALKTAEKNLFTELGKIDEKPMLVLFQFLNENDIENESRESFASAYSGIVLRQFNDEKLFPSIHSFLIEYSKSSHCFQEPGYLLSYLTKCSKEYPIECLSLLKNIDFANAPSIANRGYYRREPIQLILAIYSVFSKKPHINKANLKETLDLFDSLLKHPHLREDANIAIEEVLN
jgi:hypothetical protein